jgi:hypothetical protein
VISFFQFEGPYDSELSADFQTEFRQWERLRCAVNPSHSAARRRTGPLHHFVKHNDRSQQVIWGSQVTVHKNAIKKLEQQGFTGFRTNPAQVTFRDGVTSNDYLEFIVTGWAGVARPESGVRVVESCPGCKWKKYTAIIDFEKVIDWTQWTREDFFIVWPFSGHRFCTERAANWLKSSGLKSFSIVAPFEREKRKRYVMDGGFPRGLLSALHNNL